MILFSLLKNKIILIVAGIAITFIAGSFWYYKNSQNTIADLNSKNTELEYQLEISNNTLKSLQESYEAINKELNIVNKEFSDIRNQRKLLDDKFDGHDLSRLSFSKPKLIENIINEGSRNAKRCVELISGAPFNEQELSAKTPQEFNSECPYLWNSFNTP